VLSRLSPAKEMPSTNHLFNDESSSVAVRIDAEMESAIGKMLGDPVGPAFCV
jgi:hypothetical protein